jgi:hypothetical protein
MRIAWHVVKDLGTVNVNQVHIGENIHRAVCLSCHRTAVYRSNSRRRVGITDNHVNATEELTGVYLTTELLRVNRSRKVSLEAL